MPLMRWQIEAQFPHGIVGEEFGATREDAFLRAGCSIRIDGTKSFTSGPPMWGTLIGPPAMTPPLTA